MLSVQLKPMTTQCSDREVSQRETLRVFMYSSARCFYLTTLGTGYLHACFFLLFLSFCLFLETSLFEDYVQKMIFSLFIAALPTTELLRLTQRG